MRLTKEYTEARKRELKVKEKAINNKNFIKQK
jgi:hypothetical protein